MVSRSKDLYSVCLQLQDGGGAITDLQSLQHRRHSFMILYLQRILIIDLSIDSNPFTLAMRPNTQASPDALGSAIIIHRICLDSYTAPFEHTLETLCRKSEPAALCLALGAASNFSHKPLPGLPPRSEPTSSLGADETWLADSPECLVGWLSPWLDSDASSDSSASRRAAWKPDLLSEQPFIASCCIPDTVLISTFKTWSVSPCALYVSRDQIR